MKRIYLFMFLVLFAVPAFAQVGAVSPDFIAQVLAFLANIPYVGPVLAFIAKWGGLVAGLFTSISVALVAVLKTPELLARWAGAGPLADKIKAFADEVIPWFKYLSIFNAGLPVSPLLKKLQEENAYLRMQGAVLRNQVNEKHPSGSVARS